MFDTFKKLFTADFMPHGHCYFWNDELVWTHAIADGVIALAYATIPMSLFFIFRKRKDFKYIWMSAFFAVFILGCGATHVMDVVTIWKPYYWVDSWIRIITALASIGTAILLITITPKVLLIPTVTEWKRVNEELKSSHGKLKKSYEDLSEAQRQLQSANFDLEDKVRTRTEELEKANEKLKKINYDLDSFVYVASHDLKSPIANLQMLVKLLNDEIDSKNSPEAKELLDLVSQSVAKFDNTVHSLSEITRTRGVKNADMKMILFEEILQEVISSVSELIKENEVIFNIDFRVKSIYFSHTDLKSIFYNLVSNSIKYREANRQPVIKISTVQQNGYTVLTFSDNGIGFEIDRKEKIFMMFQRLHTHVEGTGMGMYMVKRILDNTESKIEVESEEGKGTAFTIYLKDQTPV